MRVTQSCCSFNGIDLVVYRAEGSDNSNGIVNENSTIKPVIPRSMAKAYPPAPVQLVTSTPHKDLQLFVSMLFKLIKGTCKVVVQSASIFLPLYGRVQRDSW